MPQRAATIESLATAFEVVKSIQGEGVECGQGDRRLGRRTLTEIIEAKMPAACDRWLESLGGRDGTDPPNGGKCAR